MTLEAGTRLRPIALLALAALLSAMPAAASFNYLASGDSITQGVCDTGIGQCPVAYCPDGTNLNGYPARLASSLSCNLDKIDYGPNPWTPAPPWGPPTLCTGSCCVVAAGQWGFQTSQLLSWFQNIDGDYDVILIMAGTNDIGSEVSNTTIQANIEAMDDHAVSRDIDPLLSSIIHFRDDVAGPYEADVEDLRNRIESVALARNRWFADPWTPLCTSEFCFDEFYYNFPFNDGPDPVGHPNGCGYDVMEDVFFNVITSAPIPAAPTVSGPSGDITDTTPSLAWTAATDATWHQVEVDNGATWSDLSQLADSCSGSACSRVTPALAAGAHTWRVRGRNPRGYGAWTSLAFEVFTAPPAVPTPLVPSGDVFTTPPAEFEWTDEAAAVNGADDYSLRIHEGGGEVFNGAVTPTCNGSTCTVAPPVGISTGSYTWEVKSSNVAGDSAFSAALAFDVFPPPTPVQLYPAGLEETFDDTPPFAWREIVGATEYRVEVRNATLATVWDSGLVAASGLCDSRGRCTLESAESLAKEDHTWRVRAKSSLGESAPSGWNQFEVLDCASFPDVELPPPPNIGGADTQKACFDIDVGGTGMVTVQGPNGALTLHAGGVITIVEVTVEADAELVLTTDPQ